MSKELKSYLSRKFEGRDSFLENIVFPIFGEEKFEDKYDVEALDNEDLRTMAQRTGIKSAILYGLVQVGTTEINIYDVTVSDRVMMRRNRVGIQQLIRKIMDTYTSAFIIFHYEDSDSWDWRFSFCQKDNKEMTEAKRYTFLLGPGQSCRTAADNFQKLIDKHGEINRDDIVKAFDVEALSDEFFEKYREHYSEFVMYITGKKYVKQSNNKYVEVVFHEPHPILYNRFGKDDKRVRDYIKKLLGRIVFLCFIEKKGWLGVKPNGQWNNGDKNFLLNLYQKANDSQKNNFLEEILEPLFSMALNTDRRENGDVFDTHVRGLDNNGIVRIPYLNGGLFEMDKDDELEVVFPKEYFEKFLVMLSQYNFTIDENDPNEAEVGIDPEMLGRIFESLLEDNKDKGAFYTPKEIVQYMCRESLIVYLTTCVMKKQGENHKPEDDIKESVRQLLTKPEEIVPRMNKEHLDDFGSYIRNVKICDPAIGSGAFPMGLLNELVRCRVFINAWAKDENGNLLEGDYAALKTEIISNNIYGVDIEKGAIDIARLRFWLSIIVDEQTPHVLPNFDYKFMEGNSLIPTFNGKFINLDTKSQKHINIVAMQQEKKRLYELKQKYYNAKGVEKHELNVKIKDTILKLISRQLGYESRAWYQKNAVQTTLDFDEVSSMSFDKVRQSLPAEKLESIELAEKLHAELNDNSVSVDERAKIDIRFFDWRMMFTEVFDNGGEGFDIVIGNPPYVRQEKLSHSYKQLLCTSFPDVGEGTADLYVYFFGLGLSLVKPQGIIHFITSNKYLKTEYGKNLRKTLAKDTDVIHIIDFFELPVFHNASTDAGITLLLNLRPQRETKYFPILSLENLDLESITNGNYQLTIKLETEWQFVDKEELSILNKIDTDTVSLADFANNRIYRGITTGLNSTFILSSETRTKILNRCKTQEEREKTNAVIKKAFASRYIRKYQYTGPKIWLLFIRWHFPLPFEEAENMKPEEAIMKSEEALIESYPSLYQYLLENKEELSNRNKAETGTRYEWFALQRWGANYYEEFDEPKLIYIYTAKNHEFYFDIEKHYVNNSCFFIATESKYLYWFLNSSLFSYYKKIKFVAYGNGSTNGRCKLDGNKMATVPIKVGVAEEPFESFFEKVMKTDNDEDRKKLEKEIDQLIYQLYGLTDEEIAIVEGKHE